MQIAAVVGGRPRALANVSAPTTPLTTPRESGVLSITPSHLESGARARAFFCILERALPRGSLAFRACAPSPLRARPRRKTLPRERGLLGAAGFPKLARTRRSTRSERPRCVSGLVGERARDQLVWRSRRAPIDFETRGPFVGGEARLDDTPQVSMAFERGIQEYTLQSLSDRARERAASVWPRPALGKQKPTLTTLPLSKV